MFCDQSAEKSLNACNEAIKKYSFVPFNVSLFHFPFLYKDVESLKFNIDKYPIILHIDFAIDLDLDPPTSETLNLRHL